MKSEPASPTVTERKKPKWSASTIHKRKRRAFVKEGSKRIALNKSRLRSFARLQTVKLQTESKGKNKNKDIYSQDLAKVHRCGSKATDLMAQVMENYIAGAMKKLKGHANHAGRKTIKLRDMKMLLLNNDV